MNTQKKYQSDLKQSRMWIFICLLGITVAITLQLDRPTNTPVMDRLFVIGLVSVALVAYTGFVAVYGAHRGFHCAQWMFNGAPMSIQELAYRDCWICEDVSPWIDGKVLLRVRSAENVKNAVCTKHEFEQKVAKFNLPCRIWSDEEDGLHLSATSSNS